MDEDVMADSFDTDYSNDLLQSSPSAKSDCGCGKSASLPSLAEMEANLANYESFSSADDARSGFDLGSAEMALEMLSNPSLTLEGENAGPKLQDLIKLAEYYPGLKITISF
jgi:hypothetical protein